LEEEKRAREGYSETSGIYIRMYNVFSTDSKLFLHRYLREKLVFAFCMGTVPECHLWNTGRRNYELRPSLFCYVTRRILVVGY
jgi:hypothetical protein